MAPQPQPPPAPAQQPRRRALGRNLPVAIVSGLTLAVLFVGSLFVNAWVFLAVVSVLLAIALLELDVALRGRGLRPATPVVLGVMLVLLFGTYANGPSAQSLGLVLLVLGGMTWTLLDRSRQRAAASLGVTILMGLWVPFLASYAGLLLARPDGPWLVLAAVGLSVCNDIGAFACGVRFGRHKLAPTVSPGKTWEGTVGGLLTVLLLALAIVAQLPGFDFTSATVVGVGVAIAGTVGDLAESLVKRDLGVKDLGRIIPGHGGIMDRADAIVFALPAAHLLLVAIGS